MGPFIRVTVKNTETLLNLANVVSIDFQAAPAGGLEAARITTTAGGEGLVIRGAAQMEGLRAELRRVGVLE